MTDDYVLFITETVFLSNKKTLYLNFYANKSYRKHLAITVMLTVFKHSCKSPHPNSLV